MNGTSGENVFAGSFTRQLVVMLYGRPGCQYDMIRHEQVYDNQEFSSYSYFFWSREGSQDG